jgi:hypothetical protein
MHGSHVLDLLKDLDVSLERRSPRNFETRFTAIPIQILEIVIVQPSHQLVEHEFLPGIEAGWV